MSDPAHERAHTFGAVAAAYERYRLGYPAVVAEEVVAYAGRPIRTALEIGAGTGKATRTFAAVGLSILATDPDAEMLTELRRAVPGVRTLRSTLEDLPPLEPVDLVYAAAALHWTRPEGRWDRIADLLVPDGVVASMAIEMEPTDPDLAAIVTLGGGDPHGVATPTAGPMQWPGSELLREGRFGDVRQVVLDRRVVMPASEYVGLLSTLSGYNVLPAADRAAALGRAAERLPATVEVRADVILHLARRS